MQSAPGIEPLTRAAPLLVLSCLLASGLAAASRGGVPPLLCSGVAGAFFGLAVFYRGVALPLIFAGFVLVGAGRAAPPMGLVPLPEGTMLWDLEATGPRSVSGRQPFVARAAWTPGPHASASPLPKWVGSVGVEGVGGGRSWGVKWRRRRAIVRGKVAATSSYGEVPLLFLDGAVIWEEPDPGHALNVPVLRRSILRDGFVQVAQFGSGLLDDIRRSLRRTIGLEAPAELNGLFLALVLGDRKELEDGQREAFARTGTSHLLAISGLHIGLLAAVVSRLLRGVSRRVLWVISAERSEAGWGAGLPAAGGLCAAGIYVLLAGCPTSGLRALSMLSLFVIARGIGRHTSAWNILGGAAGLVVFCAPSALADLGLQLSVASVAGLLCVPRREVRAGGLIGRCLRWLHKGTLASAATLVATAPLCAMIWGRVAVAGLWTNVPGIALIGLGTVPALLMGCLFDGLVRGGATPFFMFASSSSLLGLRLIEGLAQPSRTPMLYWQPSVAGVVGCYVGLGLLVWAVPTARENLRVRRAGRTE